MKITASRFSNTLLSLEAWLHDTPFDTTIRTFPDLFASLYAIRALQKLTIKELKQTKYLITTEDIADIAKAWPDLRFLVLPWTKPEVSSRQPTFPITALESIARTCRSLETLILSLPDHSPLNDSSLPSAPSYNNNVRVLKFRGGKWKRKIRDKYMRYLMHIFPRLDRDMVWMDEDYYAMIYR